MRKWFIGIIATAAIFLVLSGRNAEATDPEIMSNCKELWGDSYTMLESCIKREEESKKNIQNRTTSPEIMSQCKELWGNSYSMLESCIKREEEAKSRLGLS